MARYVRQQWRDGDPETPLTAARLGYIEDGIFMAPIVSTARVYKSGDQSIPTFANTTIDLALNEGVTGDALEIVTNGIRVLRAGVVSIASSVWFTGATTSERNLGVSQNGTGVRQVGAQNLRGGSADVLRCTAGDVLTLTLYTTAAATVKGGATKDTGLTVTYLGPAS